MNSCDIQDLLNYIRNRKTSYVFNYYDGLIHSIMPKDIAVRIESRYAYYEHIEDIDTYVKNIFDMEYINIQINKNDKELIDLIILSMNSDQNFRKDIETMILEMKKQQLIELKRNLEIIGEVRPSQRTQLAVAFYNFLETYTL